jgi:hypothetical protein
MNRRAFLLGAIASPIAAKVDAVSAALRPIATPNTTKWISFADYIRAKDPLSQEMIDMFIHTNDLMETITWRDQPPLDRPGEPCDDANAGRDQIG